MWSLKRACVLSDLHVKIEFLNSAYFIFVKELTSEKSCKDHCNEGECLQHVAMQWKDSRVHYPKKSSLIGPLHQVSHLPEVGSYVSSKSKRNYTQLWDWKQANEYHHLFVDGLPSNQKAFGLLAFHENCYNVSGVDRILKQYAKTLKGWTPKEKSSFRKAIWETRKNMRAITKATGRSYLDCLIYYLNIYKQTRDYKKLKQTRVQEREKYKAELILDETCVVCDDGGSLIVCEICEKGWHLACAGLKEVPNGSWYCTTCTSKSINDLKEQLPPLTLVGSPSKRRRDLFFNHSMHSDQNGYKVEDDSITTKQKTIDFANSIFDILIK